MEQDNNSVHSTLDDGKDIYITDQWKRKYHFKIASFLAPTGLALEAIEVKKDNSPGFQFNQLFDIKTDLEVAEQIFRKKIIKGLNQRHLKKTAIPDLMEQLTRSLFFYLDFHLPFTRNMI